MNLSKCFLCGIKEIYLIGWAVLKTKQAYAIFKVRPDVFLFEPYTKL
jgi:hypothetical protein